MDYTLVVNEEQAEVIAKALDLFARIGCGQLEEILRHPAIIDAITDTDGGNIRDIAEDLLAELKYMTTGLATTGITSADNPSKIAYDIFQVVRNKLAWTKNPEGGSQVYYQEPMQVSDQKLPTIDKTN